MKSENEKRVLTNEEAELVTGGGDETPIPDDLSGRDRSQPEKKNNDYSIPDGKVIT